MVNSVVEADPNPVGTGLSPPDPRIDRGYFKQLDALRAIAATFVVASHYIPSYFDRFNFGYAGVFLFFVISGFLITGILVRERDTIDQGERSLAGALRRFYVRRALRIFPLYYLAVVLCVVSLSSARATWPWHVGYAVNFEMVVHRRWVGVSGIYWSLGVEEQFYLLWPLLLLTVPRRWMAALLWATVGVGIASRAASVLAGNTQGALYLPTSCCDALGMGSLLALRRHRSPGVEDASALRVLAVLAGAALALCIAMPLQRIRRVAILVLSPTLVSVVSVALVAAAASRIEGRVGRVLELRPLRYLGTISYGIYVYHFLVLLAVEDLARRAGLLDRQTILAAAVLGTVAVASVSWHLFERPINRLKDSRS